MWSNAKNKNIHVIYTIRRAGHLPGGCAHVQTKGYEQSLHEKRGHSCITNVSTCEQERVVTNILATECRCFTTTAAFGHKYTKK